MGAHQIKTRDASRRAKTPGRSGRSIAIKQGKGAGARSSAAPYEEARSLARSEVRAAVAVVSSRIFGSLTSSSSSLSPLTDF